MCIITILNQAYYLKSFVYKYDQIEEVDGSEAFICPIGLSKNPGNRISDLRNSPYRGLYHLFCLQKRGYGNVMGVVF